MKVFVDESTLKITKAGYHPCDYLHYYFGASPNESIFSLSTDHLRKGWAWLIRRRYRQSL